MYVPPSYPRVLPGAKTATTPSVATAVSASQVPLPSFPPTYPAAAAPPDSSNPTMINPTWSALHAASPAPPPSQPTQFVMLVDAHAKPQPAQIPGAKKGVLPSTPPRANGFGVSHDQRLPGGFSAAPGRVDPLASPSMST